MRREDKKMSETHCLKLLRVCQEDSDTERAHVNADEAIIQFLTTLGYEQVADEYDKVDKWYA